MSSYRGDRDAVDGKRLILTGRVVGSFKYEELSSENGLQLFLTSKCTMYVVQYRSSVRFMSAV